jgi:AraC-like DNA-binding protein
MKTLALKTPCSHHVIQHSSPLIGVEAMTLLSNHQFPRHAHDQWGIGVIIRGGQRSWSSIGLVDAGPGDVIMVNPGEIHDGIPIDGRVREWQMVYIDPAVATNIYDEEGISALEVVRPVAQDSLLARHFGCLFSALVEPNDHMALEENLVGLVMYAIRKHGTQALRPARRAKVLKVVQRLDDAPEAPNSLAELAALSGMSRFQLLRSFTAAVGITPHAYLVQRRVRVAKQLLADGRSPAAAALQAGFADQSHLTRAFARQFGITPRRYQAAVI